MNRSILVTGGLGYIGSHVTAAFAAAGDHVVILDRLDYGPMPHQDRYPFYQGDCADKNLVQKIIKQHNITTVAHLAGSIEAGLSVTNPAGFYENNVIATKRLLDVMVGENVKEIFFSSTAAVYQAQNKPLSETDLIGPSCPYGSTKLIVETMLREYAHAYELKPIIFRYFNAAGASPELGLFERHNPETHLIPLIIKAAQAGKTIKIFGSDYETPDGTCVRDFLHVKDIASAHLLATKLWDEARIAETIFNLGSGQGHSVRQVIDHLQSLVNQKLQIVEHSRRPGDAAHLVADCTRAKNILNWQPQYSNLQAIFTGLLLSL